jgi:hypothetical protein
VKKSMSAKVSSITNIPSRSHSHNGLL